LEELIASVFRVEEQAKQETNKKAGSRASHVYYLVHNSPQLETIPSQMNPVNIHALSL
jgi:hypothetical protein